MISFSQFLEEKKGRISKDPNHDKNVEFIQKFYGKEIARSQRSNYINGTREKFLKAIEQHDAKLLKDLKDDSLDTLHDIIKKNKIQLSSKRRRDWAFAEKDIIEGFNQLLADDIFSFTNKEGKTYAINQTNFKAENAGGGRQSDIKIQKLSDNSMNVFIESKMDFLTSEYFKFGLDVKNSRMTYDHSYFLDGDISPEEKKRINQIFTEVINLPKFLNDLLISKDLVAYWKMFLGRLSDIQQQLDTDKDFHEFANGKHLDGNFPHDVEIFIQIFDAYCKHYIEKYNSLIDQIYDTYEGNYYMNSVDEFYIMDHTKDENYKEVFSDVDYMMSLFYGWNSHREDNEGLPPAKIDEQKMIALSDELKTIEVKLDRIMKHAGITNPCDLYKMDKIDKLRYFFKAFLSSVGRKKKDEDVPLIGNNLIQDELGNLQICPEIELESATLAQMITDFYVKKDKCIYLQIKDIIYLLDEDHNLFQLPNLPLFKDCIKKFLVKLLVKDDLSKIRLSVKAIEPDKSALQGCNLLSFKQKDSNYIGKKIKKIELKPNL